jgi:hypothetical protein
LPVAQTSKAAAFADLPVQEPARDWSTARPASGRRDRWNAHTLATAGAVSSGAIGGPHA